MEKHGTFAATASDKNKQEQQQEQQEQLQEQQQEQPQEQQLEQQQDAFYCSDHTRVRRKSNE